MPLASLRGHSARFDDERLNQKVKIATSKISVLLTNLFTWGGAPAFQSFLIVLPTLIQKIKKSLSAIYALDFTFRRQGEGSGARLGDLYLPICLNFFPDHIFFRFISIFEWNSTK